MARTGYVDWYNPETGQMEELPDPNYHESPWEKAQREGYGGEFEDFTKRYYEGTTDPTGLNLYDPNTWRAGVGGGDTPPIPPVEKEKPIPLVTPPIIPPTRTTTTPTAGGFSYPAFTPPAFDAPAWSPPASTVGAFAPPSFDVPEPPAPFTYPAYQALTEAEFETDPGYTFRLGEMLDTVRNERAAQGVLRTSGTLDELMRRAGGFASSEFGNVEGRRFRDWGANRDLAREESEAALRRNEILYGRESDEYKRALATHQQLQADEAQGFDRYRTGYLMGYGREADKFSRALDTYRTNLSGAQTGYGLNLNTGQLQWQNLLDLYNLSTRGLPGPPTFSYL